MGNRNWTPTELGSRLQSFTLDRHFISLLFSCNSNTHANDSMKSKKNDDRENRSLQGSTATITPLLQLFMCFSRCLVVKNGNYYTTQQNQKEKNKNKSHDSQKDLYDCFRHEFHTHSFPRKKNKSWQRKQFQAEIRIRINFQTRMLLSAKLGFFLVIIILVLMLVNLDQVYLFFL